VSDTKTHYRKAFDSPYLSAADIVDPIILTVRRVTLEKDKTKKTSDDFNTCYWVEREIRPGEALKPMILNATNSKFLADLTGSKFIDDWAGACVTVWVDNNVRFGKETVEGLRLAKADGEAQKIGKLTDELIAEAKQTKTDEAALAFWKANNAKLSKWPNAHTELKEAVAAHRIALKNAAAQNGPAADAPAAAEQTAGATA
jgi:hypothetical protein